VAVVVWGWGVWVRAAYQGSRNVSNGTSADQCEASKFSDRVKVHQGFL
jgi:hypothetical protein